MEVRGSRLLQRHEVSKNFRLLVGFLFGLALRSRGTFEVVASEDRSVRHLNRLRGVEECPGEGLEGASVSEDAETFR